MSENSKDWHKSFYDGLAMLGNSVFPKKCNSCGTVYKDFEDYITHTEGMVDCSGLMEGITEDAGTMVGLFRNCPCGSTLMLNCESRRDETDTGVERREAFDNSMKILMEHGLEEEVARGELRKLIRGQYSQILEDMGIGFSED